MAYKFQLGKAIMSGSLSQEGEVQAKSEALSGSSITVGMALLSEADLEQIDDIAPGVSAASKAVVLNSNQKYGGITALSGATLLATTVVSGATFNIGGGNFAMNHAGVITTIVSGASANFGGGNLTVSHGGALVAKEILSTSTIQADTSLSGASFAIGGGNASISHAGALVAKTSVSGALLLVPKDGLKISDVAVTATAAELNLIDGSSAGVIVNSKGVVYGDSGEVNATTLQIAGTSITSTAAELNKLAGAGADVTAAKLTTLSALSDTEIGYLDGAGSGAGVAGKALVLSSGRKVSNIAALTASVISASNLHVAANTITVGGVDIAGAEIAVLDNVVKGVASASKALVLNGGKNIGGIAALSGATLLASTIVSGAAANFGGGNATISHAGVIAADSLTLGTDLAVAHGGTGASSFTAGGIMLGNGGSALAVTAVLSDGEMLVGDGSGAPSIESGATLRTSIGVGTGDSPQFTNLTLSGDLTVNGTVATVSTTNLEVEDPLILLGSGSEGAGHANDMGFIFRTGNDQYDHGFIYDQSMQELAVIKQNASGSQFSSLSTGNLSFAKYGNLRASAMLADEFIGTLAESVQALSGTVAVDVTKGTIILANAAAGNVTLNLPTAVANNGKIIKIKKTANNNNTVTISANGSETIDGSTIDVVIESPLGALSLISDDSNWFII